MIFLSVSKINHQIALFTHSFTIIPAVRMRKLWEIKNSLQRVWASENDLWFCIFFKTNIFNTSLFTPPSYAKKLTLKIHNPHRCGETSCMLLLWQTSTYFFNIIILNWDLLAGFLFRKHTRQTYHKYFHAH